MKYDFIIIGAGIVGLSTAWQLQRSANRKRVLLLEKESEPSRHQTGHNSGVVHAGVYYEPGSLKARFCRQGLRDTHAFCKENALPFERTGKLLVATNDVELERLRRLEQRCRDNGLNPEWLDANALHAVEPAVAGIAAIRITESGITDFPAICRTMLEQFRQAGGEVRLSTEVRGLSENDSGITVLTDRATFHAGRLVACAGLMADRVAKMQGLGSGFRIIPYRGEYYRLCSRLDDLVHHLVYPVPDPALPFLGVHLTPMVGGGITVGPNAIQGWKREGYGRFNFDWRDTADMLSYPGFWRVATRHFRHGLRETGNSLCKRAYLQAVRKYCPQVRAGDLLPHPAGIRAQAVTRDGALLHDFLIETTPRSLHVCNAPSPAATSAIPIGRHICDILLNTAA